MRDVVCLSHQDFIRESQLRTLHISCQRPPPPAEPFSSSIPESIHGTIPCGSIYWAAYFTRKRHSTPRRTAANLAYLGAPEYLVACSQTPAVRRDAPFRQTPEHKRRYCTRVYRASRPGAFERNLKLGVVLVPGGFGYLFKCDDYFYVFLRCTTWSTFHKYRPNECYKWFVFQLLQLNM